ncbi:MAG: hypothetical protein JO127_04980 [Caulobacteraceae bacterium]|nr:hypothetical protein [Caulobacteraceae bacterium]
MNDNFGLRDDFEPELRSSAEAEAQREATVMPWVWGAFGVVAIAIFIALLVLTHPAAPPPAEPLYPSPALPHGR